MSKAKVEPSEKPEEKKDEKKEELPKVGFFQLVSFWIYAQILKLY